jgi:hypothetical protein
MRVDRDGDLWFGEEFGPFLVHTDATGKVLEAPIPLPGVSSPDYPADAPGAPGAGNLRRSNGFEGMAISRDGRTLYPILEGAVAGDDPRVRRLYSFDIDARRYEPGYARYEVADPAFLVSDLTRLDDRRFIALERDNFEGAAARHKKAFVIDPRVRTAGEVLVKREVVDLLAVRDPQGSRCPGALATWARGPVLHALRHHRERPAARRQPGGVRQRHELRLARAQPEPPGSLRPDRGARARARGPAPGPARHRPARGIE